MAEPPHNTPPYQRAIGQHWPQNAGGLDPRLAGYWLDRAQPHVAVYTQQRRPVARRPSLWRRVAAFFRGLV